MIAFCTSAPHFPTILRWRPLAARRACSSTHAACASTTAAAAAAATTMPSVSGTGRPDERPNPTIATAKSTPRARATVATC